MFIRMPLIVRLVILVAWNNAEIVMKVSRLSVPGAESGVWTHRVARARHHSSNYSSQYCTPTPGISTYPTHTHPLES